LRHAFRAAGTPHRGLLRSLFALALITLKIVAAIPWEALRL
jgi:DUF1365 family protein